ncbi:MAG: HisA/HisF-related TIM barrel protein [Gammaproteobacteria bacterium]|nr:HisA/HisF-related TIM barrel protein [Gammaproteobacteria bacterium]
MFLIPAIGLREGKATRNDGSPLDRTPLDAVLQLLEQGAKRIQLVDHGAQANGHPVELKTIESIAGQLEGATLQVVADIRDEDAVQSYLNAGVGMVVLGNRAASAPHVVKDLSLEYPRHIVMGIDVRDGRVVIDARSKVSNHELIDLAEHYQDDGVHAIMYREVDQKNRTAPVNADTVRSFAESISIEVQAAGHVDSIKSLEAMVELADAGVKGLVIENPLDNGIDFGKAVGIVAEAE